MNFKQSRNDAKKKITGLYNGQQNYIKLIKFLKKNFRAALIKPRTIIPWPNLLSEGTPLHAIV